MVSNTVAVKVIEIGPFIFSGAIFIFPISYIFGDILTEVYGYKATRKIVWSGFASLVLMSLAYYFVEKLPAAPFWPNQLAYTSILGAVPRIVFGSIIGYFAGEFSNSFVLSKMKIWSSGKHLWTRTVGSTVVGEAVDTMLFSLIAFVGTLPFSMLMILILSGYIAKVLYEIIATPLTYYVVYKLKKAEGMDIYDKGISYTPFAIKE